MPVFEYRCERCGKKYSALVGVVAAPDETRCPACGSDAAHKLVSRFARFRSEDDRLDEVADRMESMADPDSPSDMRSILRELGKASDEDVSDEIEEVFEADMAGEAAGDED